MRRILSFLAISLLTIAAGVIAPSTASADSFTYTDYDTGDSCTTVFKGHKYEAKMVTTWTERIRDDFWMSIRRKGTFFQTYRDGKPYPFTAYRTQTWVGKYTPGRSSLKWPTPKRTNPTSQQIMSLGGWHPIKPGMTYAVRVMIVVGQTDIVYCQTKVFSRPPTMPA